MFIFILPQAILKELDLLITVYNLSTTYQKEKKKSYNLQTLLGMSYLLKTRNRTYNKLLTRSYLQYTAFNLRLAITYFEKKILYNKILKINNKTWSIKQC